jgi:hypothetical protein
MHGRTEPTSVLTNQIKSCTARQRVLVPPWPAASAGSPSPDANVGAFCSLHEQRAAYAGAADLTATDGERIGDGGLAALTLWLPSTSHCMLRPVGGMRNDTQCLFLCQPSQRVPTCVSRHRARARRCFGSGLPNGGEAL